jgi:hypothetical protein
LAIGPPKSIVLCLNIAALLLLLLLLLLRTVV